MSNGSTGAVFFLGTRAHYQVLDQPEENGNAAGGPQPAMWSHYETTTGEWSAEDKHASYDAEKSEPGVGVKRRVRRRQSEAALCDDEMRPAALNHLEDGDVGKLKPRRVTLLSFLSSLARRKPRPEGTNGTHLRQLQGALTCCTYRESCRCLDCQSRYFECDEADSDYDYSDDSDFLNYGYSGYGGADVEAGRYQSEPEDYDDEVFTNSIPEDNTSTDLLLEGREKMSISSDTLEVEEDDMQLEVAAGTPVVLNHLLTHPIACVIQ